MRKDWICAGQPGTLGAVLSLEAAEIRPRSSFPLVLGSVGERVRRLCGVPQPGSGRSGGDSGDDDCPDALV
jgi:hypothetical protein